MRLKNNGRRICWKNKKYIENDVWNQDAVDFWNRFTFVDTSNLLNYKLKKLIYVILESLLMIVINIYIGLIIIKL